MPKRKPASTTHAARTKKRPAGAARRSAGTSTSAGPKPIASKATPPKSGAKTATPPKRGADKTAPRDRQAQAREVVRRLTQAYPDATCALKHRSAYELLVATILSAQCTDERVNMVTPALFTKYPDARALSAASQDDLESIIRSTGFFRAKSNSLRGMANAVVERFGGAIPKSLEDLVGLPGVGRKTANVVLGTAWRIPSGIVVDTHVKRIVNLLGLTRRTTPEQIEQDLMQLIPRDEWIDFSHRLIHHGRRICIARRPKCRECPLLSCCDRVGLPPLD